MMLLSMDWPSATAIIGTAVVVVNYMRESRVDSRRLRALAGKVDAHGARLDALESMHRAAPSPPGPGPIPPKPRGDAP